MLALIGAALLVVAGARDAGAGFFFQVFTVDTTADDPSLNACTSAANDCSLRGAIGKSNAATLPTTINFVIGVGFKTITLSSQQGSLPSIAKHVTIDGTTQICSIANPHPPCIAINGASAGANAIGLSFGNSASGSTVKGLSIVGFGNAGIQMYKANNMTIERNYVGTADGTTAAGSVARSLA